MATDAPSYGSLPSRLDGGYPQPIRQPLPALEEIANQAEWFVLNSHPLRVTWNGGNERSDLEIEPLDGEASYPASSLFGSGILIFNLLFLFRTPLGYNL